MKVEDSAPFDGSPPVQVIAAQVLVGTVARALRGQALPAATSEEGKGLVNAIRSLMDRSDGAAVGQGRETLAAGVLAVVMTHLVAELQADMRMPRND